MCDLFQKLCKKKEEKKTQKTKNTKICFFFSLTPIHTRTPIDPQPPENWQYLQAVPCTVEVSTIGTDRSPEIWLKIYRNFSRGSRNTHPTHTHAEQQQHSHLYNKDIFERYKPSLN